MKKKTQIQLLQLVTISRRMEMLFFFQNGISRMGSVLMERK